MVNDFPPHKFFQVANYHGTNIIVVYDSKVSGKCSSANLILSKMRKAIFSLKLVANK